MPSARGNSDLKNATESLRVLQTLAAQLSKAGNKEMMRLGCFLAEKLAPLMATGEDLGALKAAERKLGRDMADAALRDNRFRKSAKAITQAAISKGMKVNSAVTNVDMKVSVNMTPENERKIPMVLADVPDLALEIHKMLAKVVK